MSEHTITCLLCGISGVAQLVSPVLRDDSSGRFKVVRCLTCGHVELFPLPSLDEEMAFYQTDRQTRNLTNDVDFELWRKKTAFDTKRRVGWVRALSSAQLSSVKILDVGCGYGFFVDQLTNLGYSATGLDIGQERLALARAHLQGTFLEGQIDETFVSAYLSSFHVVTLFHVLEHIRNPVRFLQQCFELIMTGGCLLIEVPNSRDELLNQQEQYCNFYWQRAHLSYFDRASLELALRKAGLSNFTVRGVQRYGLRNLLHWLDKAKPQLVTPDYGATEPILIRLEALYRAERERSLTSDTLIVEVRK